MCPTHPIQRTMTATYWNKKGAYQSLYDKYNKIVPKSGVAQTPHGELLRNVANVYYDFYNNGNDTWYSVVKNGAIDMYYKAPYDAPQEVQAFFECIREEYDEYQRYLKKKDSVVLTEEQQWKRYWDPMGFNEDLLKHIKESGDDEDEGACDEEEEDEDEDDGVHHFTEKQLESIVDFVLMYVDRREK